MTAEVKGFSATAGQQTQPEAGAVRTGLKTGCVTRPEGAVIQKNTATMSPFDKGTGICSIMSKELNYNVYRHQKAFKCVSEMAC